ncbi:uracil-DNA glycosylase family protein [Crocinitomix algicola]|uniref:uracil-DNA glycosylase family protein n=1 Tax=Crocinitomix algicola TaxID=1740263 RepID=UPI000829BC2B|nr:uracil-DNA glycosylase family protein [Crocinitomix algicola]
MSKNKQLENILNCSICQADLNHAVRPVVRYAITSKILIIGQAPGLKVHKSGIPWNDQSGIRLRQWLDVSKEVFYDTSNFGIIPMGFCYPGKGKSGDLPPRKECAPKWHPTILNALKNVKLTLLIGQYAQKYYLNTRKEKNLTETVRNFENYLPHYFVLPHPSPRNGIWLSKNKWFERDLIPILQNTVKEII